MDYAKRPSPKRYSKSKPQPRSSGLLSGLFLGLAIAGVFFLFQNKNILVSLENYFQQLRARTPQTLEQVATTHHLKAPILKAPEIAPPKFTFYTTLASGQMAPTNTVPDGIKQLAPAAPQLTSTLSDSTTASNPTVSAPTAVSQSAPTTTADASSALSPMVSAPLPATTTSQTTAPAVKTAATPVPKITTANSKFVLQIASFRSVDEADRLRAELLLQGFDVTIRTSKADAQTWYRLTLGPFNSRESAIAERDKLKALSINAILRQA